jgi:hypothetical protein
MDILAAILSADNIRTAITLAAVVLVYLLISIKMLKSEAKSDKHFAEQEVNFNRRFAEIEKHFLEQEVRFDKHFAEQEVNFNRRFAEIEKHFLEQEIKFDNKLDLLKTEMAGQIDTRLDAFYVRIKENDFAHINAAIEALTFTLEKNGSLSLKDKAFIDEKLQSPYKGVTSRE